MTCMPIPTGLFMSGPAGLCIPIPTRRCQAIPTAKIPASTTVCEQAQHHHPQYGQAYQLWTPTYQQASASNQPPTQQPTQNKCQDYVPHHQQLQTPTLQLYYQDQTHYETNIARPPKFGIQNYVRYARQRSKSDSGVHTKCQIKFRARKVEQLI